MKELLCSATLASGVYDVISTFASVLPTFKEMTSRDVASALKKAASQLCFVESCSTRILTLSGQVDVTHDSQAAKVRSQAPQYRLPRTHFG